MKSKTQLRKEREREARRDAILDAAGEVFARKGYHEATLDEIADTAELGKGTLYNYYQDKQDIFVSLSRRSMEEFQSELRRLHTSVLHLEDYIRNLVDTLIGAMLKHGYLLRSMFQANAELTSRMRTEVFCNCQGEQNIVEKEIADGLGHFSELSDRSVEFCNAGAAIILGTARHMALFGLHEEKPEPTREEKDRVVTILVRALTVEAS